MIQTICICGAGTMGSGITQLAAQAGFITIQFDVNADMLTKSRNNIEANLDRLVSKGKLTSEEKQTCLQRIRFTSQLNDCKADLVIEAIIEQAEAKINLFNALAAINTPATIFATNTSSLPVTALATSVPQPERVAGMHFFNPAPLMKLVEVIRAAQTNDHTIGVLLDTARRMGKTAVECTDAPGFIVNRVARHYYLEAMRLVELGLADINTVDKVMEATGFKMGPFALMDLIGIDINYNVSNIVWEALGKPKRLTPSPLQKAKRDAGDLGRKTGKGFYEYGS